MVNVVKSCEILLVEIPLQNPYVLSFATVHKITSIIVRVALQDDKVGWAEAVPLTGYSKETANSILAECKFILPKIIGLELESIDVYLKKELPFSPFVKSAIFTACEMASGSIAFPDTIRIPLLAPVSASRDISRIRSLVKQYQKEGYRTLKLKTGKDIESDMQTVRYLLNELPDGMKVRIDANQGYSFKEAVAILDILDHPRNHLVELLEQPFGLDEEDWIQFANLASQYNTVPLMLDESIFTTDDIDRAVESGASLVKLKLFKHQGVRELIGVADYAVKAGLNVVLGNGVSSDIGNLFEAAVFQETGLFYGAFEGNGFDKLVFSLLRTSLHNFEGNLVWEKPEGSAVADLIQTEKLDVVEYYGNYTQKT